VATGASLLVEQGSLGSIDTGTKVSGTLCVAAGATVAEPIESDGGAVASCYPPDALLAIANGTYEGGGPGEGPGGFPGGGPDAPQAALATLTGAIDDEGGVSFGPYACYSSVDNNPDLGGFGLGVEPLIDGVISGTGDVHVGCTVGDGGGSGPVAFGGNAPNTYTGTTIASYATLVLAKPDGVIALPADAEAEESGALALGANDQIAPSADIDVSEFDVGAYQATVASLDAGTLDTTVRSDGAAGLVHVTESAGVDTINVNVDSDPPIGEPIVVVDNQASAPVDRCPAGSGGSDVSAYKVSCAGGNGNDIAITPIWKPTVSIAADPRDGAITGATVTFTATVTTPAGGSTATDQVSLISCPTYYCDPYSGQITTIATSTVDSSGVATFTLPDNWSTAGTWLKASYLGDSLHAPAQSPVMHYLSWPASATGGAPPGAPSWEVESYFPKGYGGFFCGDLVACLYWNAPSNTGGAPIVSYHITVTPQGGTPYVVDTNTSINPVYTSFEVRDLLPGTTYTFAVAAVNHSGVG
ncbi:MAG: fibronectin type III domain-containing protein, partial [Trebonia sp.]